jgi:hypothetical protein
MYCRFVHYFVVVKVESVFNVCLGEELSLMSRRLAEMKNRMSCTPVCTSITISCFQVKIDMNIVAEVFLLMAMFYTI